MRKMDAKMNDHCKLVFQNLNVLINKTEILHNVSGIVKSKEVLAIMGPSGSGKTTLLNTLAGRGALTSGEIRFNDQKLNKRLRRNIGYVLQEDIFFANLTLWETLYFTAKLNLPETLSEAEKLSRIEDVIEALDLVKCKGTRIGSMMNRGLSGGEKKRTSIACELLTNPLFMLLDEPTSGLDSSMSFSLMAQLKKYAEKSNKAIIVTIHQPASQLYHMFSKLLLLAEGHMAYFGRADKALDYFEGINLICEQHYNPADFMLEVLKGDKVTLQKIQETWKQYRVLVLLVSVPIFQGVSFTGVGTYISRYQLYWCRYLYFKVLAVLVSEMKSMNSAQNDDNNILLNDTTRSSSVKQNGLNNLQTVGHFNPAFQDVCLKCVKIIDPDSHHIANNNNNNNLFGEAKWQSTFWTQLKMLTWRNFKEAKDRVLSKYSIVLSAAMALMTGLVWFQLERSYQTIRDRMGWAYFVVVFLGFMPIQDAIISFSLERGVMMKERATGSYRLSAYYLAKCISELPLMFIQPTVFMLIAYWMAGLKGVVEFFISLGVILISALNAQGCGFVIGAAISDIKWAMTTTTTFMLCGVICGGFYVQRFPSWFYWIRYASIIHYPFGAISILEFSDTPDIHCTNVTSSEFPRCKDNSTDIITAKMMLADATVELPFQCYISTMVLIAIAVRFIAYFVLRVKSKQKYL